MTGGRRLALLLLLTAAAVGADIVFRVPEVMVRHTAAPRAVGSARATLTRIPAEPQQAESATGEAGPAKGDRTLLELSYEEYFIEHDISTVDARAAAQTLNVNDIPWRGPGCGSCSRRELQYCETRVVADHCCCERRYIREPFPWLPHTCYMGARRCRPTVRDCALYTRIRDCCCTKRLATKWKGILSGGPRMTSSPWLSSLVAATLLVTMLADTL